jgi:hypothetical protein
MLLILYFLVWIVTKARQGGSRRCSCESRLFLFVFPFRIHCGWIVAASLVNINLVLVKNTVSAAAQFYTALVSLGCPLMIALTCLFVNASTDYVIPCVLAWAAVSFTKLCRKDGLGEKPFLTKLLRDLFLSHTYIHTHTHSLA